MNISDKGKRVGNYIIDSLVIIFITTILLIGIYIIDSTILNGNFNETHLLLIVFFLYYFLFELFTNRTIGKILTKTIVVDKNGNKPSAFKLFIRNIIRLIPFDAFTFLFGNGNGLHDLISQTTVINSNR